MPLITRIPHPPTIHFYREALKATRVQALAPEMAHLRRKLRYNIRDGISIHRHERDLVRIQELIQDGHLDLAIIRACKDADPLWLKNIFKKPTSKSV